MTPPYSTGTDHANKVQQALEDFHEALTLRWREVVCRAVVENSHDYPVFIRRTASPHTHQTMWEYWSLPARHHFGPHGGCAYVAWVEGGQQGPLSAVTCDGATGASEDVELMDPTTREMVTIPPYIECGMGRVLAQVEDWAWGERDHLFYRLPLFDHHDEGALGQAHEDIIGIGRKLALQPEAGSDGAVSGSFEPVGARDIPGLVSNIASRDAGSQDWWTGWTGLAAERAGAGFFASVVPSLNNQSGITGVLANLYYSRSEIIKKGRNDTVHWIQWATDALGETGMVTTKRTGLWRTLQGFGGAVVIGGSWSVGAAVVGAGVSLFGFVGENIDDGSQNEVYSHGVEEVVGGLNDKIDTLNREIDSAENEYFQAVTRLRNDIHGIHSFNLELYDLTRNSPDGEGAGRGSGYDADVGSILRLAEDTYRTGELYEGLLPEIAATSGADRHLADKDGNRTAADTAVLEVRDQLEQFLKTSCGRYLVAGDQVKQAAEAYLEVDSTEQQEFRRITESWQRQGVGDVDFDPDRYAQETGRGDDDPWQDHPARGGSAPPGAGDGDEYVVDR